MSVEVSFELPDPALAADRWRLACERDPQSHPPLIAELYAEMLGDDAVAVGGYMYLRDEDDGDGGGATTLDRLEEEWLPRVEALALALDGLEPGAVGERGWAAALGARIDEWAAISQRMRRDILGPTGRAAAALTDAFATHFGEGRRDDARALIEAIPSRESRRAIAVWEMSRLLRSQGSRLSQTFGPTGGQREYMQGLERAQRDFGDTTPGYRQDVPSWRENRAMLTRAIREAAALPDTPSPPDVQRARLAQRRAATAEIAASASDPAVANLMALLPAALEHALALAALEEPTERLVAAGRRMWLRLGEHLKARGALHEAGDVFSLARAELIAALEGGAVPAPDEIARRRAEQAAFEAAMPPAILGGGEAA